jgi:hypothetical protein
MSIGAAASLIFSLACGPMAVAQTNDAGPTEDDWRALASLPDFSGVWIPDVTDQRRRERGDPAPWTAAAGEQIEFLFAEEEAGRPKLVLDHCLPHGMPSWMLITHNAMEILLTPGRVTMLGEGDGNRMRRIFTDGRSHPEDPDLTMHGHSIGRWEADTLVVDTVGIVPQSYIALTEAVGVPNNGDMHIVERIRLVEPDRLAVDLTITAPKVMTEPWQTTRFFNRRRGARYDIIEGYCVQGQLVEGTDEHGNAIYEHVPPADDGRVIFSP